MLAPAKIPTGRQRRAGIGTAWAASIVAILLAASGCQTSGIKARELPPELRATGVFSAQHLDLSRFAQGNLKNEIVYPGDTIMLSISTGLEDRDAPRYMLRVDEEGAVNVPLVGHVRVAGLELTAAESLIREASVVRGIYRNPQVAVAIDRRRSNKVTILGAVAKEGTYELPSNKSDLVSAIVAAGGLTTEASTLVEIRRPPDSPLAAAPGAAIGLVSYESGRPNAMLDRFDLKEPRNLDPRRLNIEDGATVMVMRRPKQAIQVMGLVRKPGQFELEPDQDVRLLDALAMAGGLSTEIANKVIVVRNREDGTESIVIQATVRGAKKDHLENIVLAPGDVVSVEETPVTFLVGELQKYVRFGISASTGLNFF
ncbi:MAG: polysaccharide biosynthesis/export family protein [Pirellulales bacterium]